MTLDWSLNRTTPAGLLRTVVALALIASVSPALASQTASPNAMAHAQRLRETGDFSGAARLLREQLAREPNNGDVARLLAETLYWLGDVEGARSTYEAALARHPQDSASRLQYGRMLVETGDQTRARDIVTPLLQNAAAAIQARALLGTLAYWQGDLSAAAILFEEVLRGDPSHAEARRQLAEIRAVSAPWLRVSSGLSHDDQPLDLVSVAVEGGWFATPLLPVTVRVEPALYRRTGLADQRLLSAEAVVSHFAPALRLESEVMAGVFERTAAEGFDWKGRAMVGVRLPRRVSLRARAERSPYLYTESSLETPVVVQTGTALVHWQDPTGWLGEAAYQHQRFSDANAIRTVYAWQLVPLVYRTAGEFQLGYAFAREHADESRFMLASPTQPFPPSDPRFNTAGRYVPYYTPSHVVSHSAIVAMAGRPSRAVTLRVGGAYAFRAREEAPAFVVSAGQLQRTLAVRDFSPWNVRASMEVALGGRTTLMASGERRRTAFYQWSSAGIQLNYRFLQGP